jgi:cell wall-associated NlpC family hydrolase
MYLAAAAASCTEQGRHSPAEGDGTVSYSDAIVAQAKLWVGYREGPGNQNMFSTGLGLPPEAWCQDFVQFVSASAGYKQPHTTSGVVSIGDWAHQHGLFIVSTNATPGCQILYDFSNGDGKEPVDAMKTHTGIYIGGGQTIEGNTGMPEGVHQKNVTLGASDIWGAINWPKYWHAHPEPFSMSVNRFPRYPVLQQNSREDDRVIGLQRALNSALGIKLDVDGEFGPKTAGACRQFQRASRIPVTGIANQATWASLDIALDKLRK